MVLILQALLRFFQNWDPVIMSASVSFQNIKGDVLWLNVFSDKGKFCFQPLRKTSETTLTA
jgi:hypothetical protein